jgi:hypothetical protein
MSASVPDACEVLPRKSPRFGYHTRVAAAGDQPHHTQVHAALFTLHFPRKCRTGSRSLNPEVSAYALESAAYGRRSRQSHRAVRDYRRARRRRDGEGLACAPHGAQPRRRPEQCCRMPSRRTLTGWLGPPGSASPRVAESCEYCPRLRPSAVGWHAGARYRAVDDEHRARCTAHRARV